jgi:predicted dehydrogenase
MREFVHEGFLGDIYYFDSVRVNLGLFQQDVNVIWDLASHDFSILDHVLAEKPQAVQVVAVQRASRTFEDIAYVTVFYPSGTVAHVHVSWLSPVKVRSTLLAGSERMLVWDDLAPDEKLKVYDHGVTLSEGDAEGVYQMMVDYRIGDIWIPHIDRTEALAKEVAHFVDCIEGKAQPRTGGESGLRVVELLTAASLSAKREGERVTLR